jgi:FlaA1/EpsC-like NDP-sugar epimerase
MFCLSGAVALAMWAFEPSRVDFWHSWFLDLPVWVTPTFSLLASSRTYVTVWTRARVLDVLMLFFTLVVGLMLSLGIALVIDPGQAGKWLLRAMVVGGTSGPAIVGVRVFYRVIEELVAYFRAKSETQGDRDRVLLYGAGGRCQLFLKERGFSNSSSYDSRLIVGLIDDEPSLHAQWVYGHPVLGGGKDLPRIVASRHVSEIIITAGLTPESRAEVRRIALELGLQLSEWCFETRRLEVELPSPVEAHHPVSV